MRILDVWLDGQDLPVGQLTALDNGNVQFRYSPELLGRGMPISLSLPLTDQPAGAVQSMERGRRARTPARLTSQAGKPRGDGKGGGGEWLVPRRPVLRSGLDP